LSDKTDVAELVGARYQVLSKLGVGAFGEVYKAQDTVLKRTVAIKRIRLDSLADPAQLDDAQARFLREAQTAAVLSHPHVVTIHDIQEKAGFIVMEFIEGVTLQSVLASKKRLSLGETIEILAQAAQALDYAHQNRVVHRDIKPANIMLEPTGRVKVTDFGIAKAESSTNLTATGSIMGTPNYMSPEQAQGKKVDGRADLFSLGCIMYECLSGTKPFRGDNLTAVLMKILTEEPPPIDCERAGLPPAVLTVVQRALAKLPGERFQTGQEMIEALRSLPVSDAAPATLAGATQVMPVAPATRKERSGDATAASGSPSTHRPSPTPPPPPPLASVRSDPSRSGTIRRPRADVTDSSGGGRKVLILAAAAVVLIGIAAGLAWMTMSRPDTVSNLTGSEADAPRSSATEDVTPEKTAAEAETPADDRPVEPGSRTEDAPSHPQPPAPVRPRAAEPTSPPRFVAPTPPAPVSIPPPQAIPEEPAPVPAQEAYPPEIDGSQAGRRLADAYRKGGRAGSAYGGSRAGAPRAADLKIRANERAAAERLSTVADVQARYAAETGRFGTAQELLQWAGRDPEAVRTLRLASNPIFQGYRYQLEVPRPDFFYMVAVPVSYGSTGVHSFYVDPQGLRAADKGGRPATTSDPPY
jgi:serine/threonine-protein kinase